MTSLLIVVAWCIIPLAAASYLVQTGLLATEWDELLRFVSPVTVIGTAEALGKTGSNTPVTSNMVVMVFVQLGLAAALTWWVRRLCLTNADHYLGRI
jgi:hypothetical protein